MTILLSILFLIPTLSFADVELNNSVTEVTNSDNSEDSTPPEVATNSDNYTSFAVTIPNESVEVVTNALSDSIGEHPSEESAKKSVINFINIQVKNYKIKNYSSIDIK